jgi:hypothetical protein
MYKTVDDDSMEWNPKETGKKTKERGKRNGMTVTEETKAIYLFFQKCSNDDGGVGCGKRKGVRI